jgi:DNA primase catalytic subunit
MLLSKALKMQQDLEDKRQEAIIENLENKIKEQSTAIEKKNLELQTAEGLLVDDEAKITELNLKLLSQSENFEQEKLKLDARLEAETQRNLELKESLKKLQNKCLEFCTRCIHQLKQVFHFVGASSEEFTPSAEDLPGAFEHIEGEINDLDEVIAGHSDFCALAASRGTAVAFLKSGCGHGKIVNRPNFSLSPADLDDVPKYCKQIYKVNMDKGWSEQSW